MFYELIVLCSCPLEGFQGKAVHPGNPDQMLRLHPKKDRAAADVFSSCTPFETDTQERRESNKTLFHMEKTYRQMRKFAVPSLSMEDGTGPCGPYFLKQLADPSKTAENQRRNISLTAGTDLWQRKGLSSSRGAARGL